MMSGCVSGTSRLGKWIQCLAQSPDVPNVNKITETQTTAVAAVLFQHTYGDKHQSKKKLRQNACAQQGYGGRTSVTIHVSSPYLPLLVYKSWLYIPPVSATPF